VPLAVLALVGFLSLVGRLRPGPGAEGGRPAPAARKEAPRASEKAAANAPEARPAESAAKAEPADYIQSPSLNNFPALRPKEPLKLSVSASTDAWVRISADGQVALETILRPGQKKEIVAQDDFEMKLGRPAAITLSLNGYALGSPGNGQAKHVVIKREGMIQVR
jgi:hypothetical protein